MGDRVDRLNVKKVRKINNCLVAGAGRFATILQFFDWFEEWSDAQIVQGQAPHVRVFVPEGIDDEDFTGLVVFEDETIFLYEGGKKSYELEGMEYYSVGSGADFALAAMDFGASAEEAVRIAANRDCFSGGEIFTETLDEEEPELTREEAEGLSKESLINMLFGTKEEAISKEDSETTVEKDEVTLLKTERVVIYSDGNVKFINPEDGDILLVLPPTDFEHTSRAAEFIEYTFTRDYLRNVAKELEFISYSGVLKADLAVNITVRLKALLNSFQENNLDKF